MPLAAQRPDDKAAVATDFMRAVRTGDPAPTTAVDNLRSLAMVFDSVEAAEHGREMALDRIWRE